MDNLTLLIFHEPYTLLPKLTITILFCYLFVITVCLLTKNNASKFSYYFTNYEPSCKLQHRLQ